MNKTVYEQIVDVFNGNANTDNELKAIEMISNPISGIETASDAGGAFIATMLYVIQKGTGAIAFKGQFEDLNHIEDMDEFVERLLPMCSEIFEKFITFRSDD